MRCPNQWRTTLVLMSPSIIMEAHKAYKRFPNDCKSPESASNRPNEVESSSDFAIMLIPESKPLGEPTGAGSSLEGPGEFRGGD